MSAVVEEPLTLDVLFVETDDPADAEALEQNRREVLAANRDASSVEGEWLAAFLDLLAGADAEYIDAGSYAPPPPSLALDWDAVSQALSESQQLLVGVQNLLSETLAAMDVEDHQFIRVYSEPDGSLKLVSDHPRRDEIETALNGPDNRDLRTLYQAAVSGMGLAGGLVGAMAVPAAVLERLKAKQTAA